MLLIPYIIIFYRFYDGTCTWYEISSRPLMIDLRHCVVAMLHDCDEYKDHSTMP